MIQIEGVKKKYGKQVVLKGVELKIPQGSIQALLGVNGAGKTTLTNIVSGLTECDTGVVFIDSKKITPDASEFRKKTGCVFEHPLYIEKFSAFEYLTFIGKMFGINKDDLKLRVSELIDFFEFPENKYIEKYSKGMKSKVSLAAAIIHKPLYLILDEPFDGFDLLSVQRTSRLLKSMAANGCTILITSHQFDVIASLCDKFALIKQGLIEFNSTLYELQMQASNLKLSNEQLKSYIEHIMDENLNSTKNLSWLIENK